MLAASQSERQPLLSTTEVTPLFHVHEWRWEASVATPQSGLYAVLAMQVAPGTADDGAHFELLLLGGDGFLSDGCAAEYVVCPGPSCQVAGCARAVPQ